MPQKRMDLTGHVYGRLTVIGPCEVRKVNGVAKVHYRVYWRCRCECGTEKWAFRDALRNGGTRSCGCLNRENLTRGRHGHDRVGRTSPEYKAWHSMKQRCLNSNNTKFALYGGRGITVCERWLVFDNFLADMGSRPNGKTIDRIDGNRGYEPGNCRWATVAEQNRNHSRNRNITFNGETMCLTDWIKRLGVKHGTMYARIERLGVERAFHMSTGGAQ